MGVNLTEALLREIVEISGESSADRIIRKTRAAATRLIPNLNIELNFNEGHQVEVVKSSELKGEQLDLVEILVNSANLAISNINSSDLANRLQINEERLRIARDLHDRVLQRIFAVGISLEGALRKAVVDDVISALRSAIVDLDATVGQIRTTVYSLKGPLGSIRHQLLNEIESARKAWDISIDFNLLGPIDSVIPKEIYDDIIAVTAELLNNAGKHASSGQIKYELAASGAGLEISVSQNSGEFKPINLGSGLENLSDRANKYGGQLLIENLQPGLRVIWKITL